MLDVEIKDAANKVKEYGYIFSFDRIITNK